MPAGVSVWNVFRPTTVLNLQTVFPTANGISRPFLRKPPLILASATSSSAPTPQGTMAKWSAATGKTRNAFTLSTLSSLWLTSSSSLLSITAAPTTFRCVHSLGFLLSSSLSNLFDKLSLFPGGCSAGAGGRSRPPSKRRHAIWKQAEKKRKSGKISLDTGRIFKYYLWACGGEDILCAPRPR